MRIRVVIARSGGRKQTATTGRNQSATDQPTMPTNTTMLRMVPRWCPMVPDGARRGFMKE